MLLSVFKEQKGNDVVVDTSFPPLYNFSFVPIVVFFLSEGIEPIRNICHKIYVRSTGFSVGDRILGNGTFRTFILTKYII